LSKPDVIVIGAGHNGLVNACYLARAGRKVLVVERSNSVGGAASSYKVGDLFVEGSLHETSDPRDPRDPKHEPLTRAGVLDAVTWVPGGALYEARGGPLGAPFILPDNFDAARAALTQHFPEAKDGIAQLLGEMEAIAAAGREGEMVVVGGAGMKEIVKRIMDKDPMLPVNVTYPPAQISAAIEMTALAFVSDAPMTGRYIIGSQLITPENAERFYFPDSPF